MKEKESMALADSLFEVVYAVGYFLIVSHVLSDT